MKKFYFFIIVYTFIISTAYAKIIYVDGNINGDCLSGNYSIANRQCNGFDGFAYTTIVKGLNSLSNGDTLLIREGTYDEIYGSYFNKTNVTIAGFSGETVLWQYSKTVVREAFLPSGSMDGLVVKNINFKGLSFESLNSGNFNFVNAGNNIYYIDRTETRAAKFQKKNGETWSVVKRASSECGYACTNTQCEAALSDEPDGAFCEAFMSGNRDYIKSTNGNPATRSDLRMIGIGKIIGLDSSNPLYTFTIEDCTFEGAGHAILKGNNRWIVRRCSFKDYGYTFNDHAMYIWGEHADGSETIIENCYFENSSKSGNLHLYYGGSGFIVRNNVFRSVNRGDALFYVYNMCNVKIYNNTFYGQGRILVSMDNVKGGNLEIKNNIFQNGGVDYDVDFQRVSSSLPVTVSYNITNNENIARYAENLTGFNNLNNIISSTINFVSASPNEWYDFQLNSGSVAIDAGVNLGSENAKSLKYNKTNWPPALLNQNNFGSGWEIGAFLFKDRLEPPLNLIIK